jgi:flavodoxin
MTTVGWEEETMPRALIVCVSGSAGNTQRVAVAIAEVLGADVRDPQDVRPEDLSNYDIVGFGSVTHLGAHHSRLRRLVSLAPRVEATWAFVFETSGIGRRSSRHWRPDLESALADRGFDVIGAFISRGFDTWPLGVLSRTSRGHPDESDLARARAFAEMVGVRAAAHKGVT